MEELLIKPPDAQAINALRFEEEIEAALGVEVRLVALHDGGALAECRVRRADGFPLDAGQAAAIKLLAAEHDPGELSSAQALEADRRADHAAASHALILFDPAGIANMLAAATTFGELRDAAVQLADLTHQLTVLALTEE